MRDTPRVELVWNDRIRVTGVAVGVAEEGRCRAEVELTLAGGARTVGEADGPDSLEGRMEAGADATLDALVPVLRGRLALALTGIRTLEAFDTTLVIAAVDAEGGAHRFSLVGAVSAPEEDFVRGAVLAVLDAANRVVEHFQRSPR